MKIMRLQGVYYLILLPPALTVYVLCHQVAIQGGPLRGEGLQTSNPWTERWTASHILSRPASGNRPHLPEAWSLLRAELDGKEETSAPWRVQSVIKRSKVGFGETPKFIEFLGSPLVADSTHEHCDLIRPQRR